ncbi:hypothetical protein J4Q44_G00153160 [Coregonus suidteri]|uniref:Uncharacterized protein n=1 Tax=Coregonus suidteri TaxID=861788 RepID=A0AAN8LSS5_9TELE
MFQLESHVLPRRSETIPLGEEDEDFLSIAQAMEEIVEDPVDCYWMIKCFVNQFNNKFGDSIPHLVSSGVAQESGALFVCGGVSATEPSEEYRGLPYSLWFRRCFAGCLPESSLQRVWDKVISGSFKILVFVAVAILLSYTIMVMGTSRPEGVVNFLCKQVPQENTDAIVTKAIELWHKYCCTRMHSV